VPGAFSAIETAVSCPLCLSRSWYPKVTSPSVFTVLGQVRALYRSDGQLSGTAKYSLPAHHTDRSSAVGSPRKKAEHEPLWPRAQCTLWCGLCNFDTVRVILCSAATVVHGIACHSRLSFEVARRKHSVAIDELQGSRLAFFFFAMSRSAVGSRQYYV
jgi:hypothetical protein